MRGVDILYKEEFETTEKDGNANKEMDIDELANKVAERLVDKFSNEQQDESQEEMQEESLEDDNV